MKLLSTKQQQVLAYMHGYWNAYGRMPTVREVGARMRVTVATARDHLNRLVVKGYLKRDEQARWRKLRFVEDK